MPSHNLVSLCPLIGALCPGASAWADATLAQTTRPCPSALVAAPPDLALGPEAGCLPDHGELVWAHGDGVAGGWPRVMGKEAGLVSPSPASAPTALEKP